MSDYEYKSQKIRSLANEVIDFHPILRDLLHKLPNVSNVFYTHGNNEMGADFVIVRTDNVLGSEEYVGLIVKIGDIKQNYDGIKRQINECCLPRKIDGGKRQIYLSEIWVCCNGSTTRNAEEKIHHEFRDKKVKFLASDRLIRLIDKHYPDYWEDIDKSIGLYLSSIERRINELNKTATLAVSDVTLTDFYVEQDLIQIEFDARKQFSIRATKKSQRLSSILENERFTLIEAGMGYGKSRLLRNAVLEMSKHRSFTERGVLPVFINFRDLVDTYENSLDSLLNHLRTHEKINPDAHRLLFVIDAVDEVKGEAQVKAQLVTDFIAQVMPHDAMSAVFASRPFEDPIAEQALERSVVRFALQPLSIERLLSFVEKICSAAVVTSRLRNDLCKSDLFRSLPRTPISAILLARVLKAEIKELPSTLPELYSKYLELALGRWEITKGHGSEKEYETTVILARLIAKFMLDSDLSEIGVGDAKAMIREYLDRRELGQTADQVFQAILGCSEIFCIDEVRNKMFFRHRSFMEFLYAEHMFVQHGAAADILKPFDPYWNAVIYFYLGRLKDCPEQIHKVFALQQDNESRRILKFFQAGAYLLAAYQTPYQEISNCVRNTIQEAADLYCRICEDPTTSNFGKFSELTLLSIITAVMCHAFEYDFFKKALIDAETDILMLVETDKRSAIAAFLVGAIRAGLGCKSAFESLAAEHQAHLPLAVRLGISHAAKDAQITNDAIKKLAKKMGHSRRDNPKVGLAIRALYDVPMDKRKDPRLA